MSKGGCTSSRYFVAALELNDEENRGSVQLRSGFSAAPHLHHHVVLRSTPATWQKMLRVALDFRLWDLFH